MSENDLSGGATRRSPVATGWVDSLAETRPQRVGPPPGSQPPLPDQPQPATPRRRLSTACGCSCLLPVLALTGLLAIYLFAPLRSNILILGIDTREATGMVGRTDTNILVTVVPLRPYIGMLSIPRDLWVTIPNHGEGRINTAHFFAEAEQPGSGPLAAIETIRLNFGVPVHYFVRIRFDGLKDIVDALDGVEVEFLQPSSGFTAGRHRLNGEQALAFVRDRQGADDFFRMANGQLFLKSMLQQMLAPASWPKLPAVLRALPRFVDTDMPVWQWPRLGLALLRAGEAGIDSRVITREMVTPFTTPGGAAVLAPDWEAINPVLLEMFDA